MGQSGPYSSALGLLKKTIAQDTYWHLVLLLLLVGYDLANNQLLYFAELFVGDTDEICSLGKIANVDSLNLGSIHVLVIDNATAHVDKHTVDHTFNAFYIYVHLRTSGVGL